MYNFISCLTLRWKKSRRYIFPRQLTISQFWTPQQQSEYLRVYHAQRAQCYGPLLKGLERAGPQVKDAQLQTRLLTLCNKVQSGVHPSVSEITAVRELFSGPPLGIKWLSTDLRRQLCPLLFLTPRLPAVVLCHRLSGHATELMQLDHALLQLGLNQLKDAELKKACYVRGLNSEHLNTSQCQEWLAQWIQLSTHLKESEASLLLHSMVLLTANYLQPTQRS